MVNAIMEHEIKFKKNFFKSFILYLYIKTKGLMAFKVFL